MAFYCSALSATGEFQHLKEVLSPPEILTGHKYLRQILKVHYPKGPAGFINEPTEVFLNYIPGSRFLLEQLDTGTITSLL